MKKIISLIFIVFIVVISSSIRTTASNGIPYETYTFSRSQRKLIRTQDAYIPLAQIKQFGSLTLDNPQDITIDKDNNIYIADTGNSRILKFSLENNDEPQIIGQGFLQEPTGITLDLDGNLYVADFSKEEVYKYDENYQIVTTYKRPINSPLFLDTEPFKPTKVVVDHGKNVYIVIAGNINGLAQYSNNGDFFGYFGGNEIPATFENIIRNLLFNEEQRRKWFKMIPKPVYNVGIDNKGMILSTTKTFSGYKKINIGNTVISQPYFGYTNNEAIAVGPINNIFTISEDGFIIEYSANGDMLFIFGGRDEFLQKGLYYKPSGIVVDEKNNIYTLDAQTNSLQIYYPTEFTNTIHTALNLYQNGQYAESEDLWNEVLTMNRLFDLAHKGLGDAAFANEEYEDAMVSYRYANDKLGYSNAYWEVRNISLLANAQYLILILFILFILYIVNQFVNITTYIFFPFRYINRKLKRFKLYNEVMYLFTVLRHPLDAYYGIKKQNKTSNLSATVLMIILYSLYIISLYCTGFIFNHNIVSQINIGEKTVTVLLPFILWVIANYLVCSIRDGEGRFKHVYQASAYMLSPMIIALPILTFISNYLTFNESFLYEFGFFVAIAITILYIILMVKEIHNYNVRSSVINIFISIFTALMIAVVVFIVYILLSEIFKFFSDIITEVMSRG